MGFFTSPEFGIAMVALAAVAIIVWLLVRYDFLNWGTGVTRPVDAREYQHLEDERKLQAEAVALRDWLTIRIEENRHSRILVKTLYEDYALWCAETGAHPISRGRFLGYLVNVEQWRIEPKYKRFVVGRRLRDVVR